MSDQCVWSLSTHYQTMSLNKGAGRVRHKTMNDEIGPEQGATRIITLQQPRPELKMDKNSNFQHYFPGIC